MIKTKKLVVPIYDNNKICIIVTDEVSELEKYVGFDFVSEELNGAVNYGADKSGFRTVFIALNPDNKYFDESVIVHECVHAANRILNAVGVKADYLNDEAQTYLIDWIFKEVKKFLKKIGK